MLAAPPGDGDKAEKKDQERALKEQEETDRLIALVLAEEDGYGSFGPYDGAWANDASSADEDGSSEDYDPRDPDGNRSKRTRKSRGNVKKRRTQPAGRSAEQETDSKTKPKSKLKGVSSPQGQDGSSSTLKAGKYHDDEESLFLEGLDLYGRQWHKLAEHMGHTREEKNIRSHAQTHFIRLFRDGEALPAKVAESGGGYTLSGKPLDPESAAARRYLESWNKDDERNKAAVEMNSRGLDV